jgi:hypothetical protein
MMRLGTERRGRARRPRTRWLDPRGRHLGAWAFIANRLTGWVWSPTCTCTW